MAPVEVYRMSQKQFKDTLWDFMRWGISYLKEEIWLANIVPSTSLILIKWKKSQLWGFSIHYSSKSMILKSDKMQFPLSLMNYIFFLVTFKSYCRSMAHSYLLPAELLKWLLRFLGLSMSLRSENRYVKDLHYN